MHETNCKWPRFSKNISERKQSQLIFIFLTDIQTYCCFNVSHQYFLGIKCYFASFSRCFGRSRQPCELPWRDRGRNGRVHRILGQLLENMELNEKKTKPFKTNTHPSGLYDDNKVKFKNNFCTGIKVMFHLSHI